MRFEVVFRQSDWSIVRLRLVPAFRIASHFLSLVLRSQTALGGRLGGSSYYNTCGRRGDGGTRASWYARCKSRMLSGCRGVRISQVPCSRTNMYLEAAMRRSTSHITGSLPSQSANIADHRMQIHRRCMGLCIRRLCSLYSGFPLLTCRSSSIINHLLLN